VGILLDPTDRRKFLKVRDKGKSKKIPIYAGNDDISGVVTVELKDIRKYEHLGLRIDLIGHLCTSKITQRSTAIII
jgi:vacuolar protein sorting-associated protein 26